MNPFVIKLACSEINSSSDLSPNKFVVEDNIGEGIHIHYRNLRFEFSVAEYQKFSKKIDEALKRLEEWE